MEVDENLAATVHGLTAGSHVCLTMTDTGHGMDEMTLARIFEPFFTTKRAGEGTGLGLAVVHGIVQSHEGAIAVSSRPGEGTRFSLYFPALAAPAASPKCVPVSEIPHGHGERILYVDDEKSLADMGKKILERLGYVVEAYYDPKEALCAIAAHRANFHLVVTDLTMPTMTGLEFATQLQVIRPSLPIVLTTGYAPAMTPTRFQAVGVREVVLKPHSVETLAGAVARVLSAANDGVAASHLPNIAEPE
jgi:CheY-like chemotaxis protein